MNEESEEQQDFVKDITKMSVDFDRWYTEVVRKAEMADLACRLESMEQRSALIETLMHEWRDGRVKLATIALLLALRRTERELFSAGDYQPIVIEGDRSDWAFGYFRSHRERRLAVLIARYPAHREAEPEWSAVARLPEGRWFDLFRARFAAPDDALRDWLHPLPFAVLLSQ